MDFASLTVNATASSIAQPAPRFLTASLAREMGILLFLSVMFPFMVHILPVPADERLGPRLLPMFYAPLLAALWGRRSSAVLIGCAAPWLNWLLTSHPAPRMGIVMSIELLAFVVALRWLITRTGPRWFLAAPAFVCAKIASTAAVALLPMLIGGRPPFAWAIQGTLFGLPGIAVLVLINWLALRHYPSGPEGHGPAAA